MKKTVSPLFIFAILIIASSCKKPCYQCQAYYFAAAHIDTFYDLGQMKFDTFGGQSSGLGPDFTTCSKVQGYYYDSYVQPYSPNPDTLVYCLTMH